LKKLLITAMALALVATMVGLGVHAYFSDTETSTGNYFQARTLDLKVDGKDDPEVVSVTLGNMKPGDVSVYYKWVLKNAGDMPGMLSVTFGTMDDQENGINRPEGIAEAEPYGKHGARPTLGHPERGELSEFLAPGIHPAAVENMPGVKIVERNDEEGWWIAEVEDEIDTGGSCGWGPKGWNVPSTVISQWAVGPSPAYAGWYFGLKSWEGKTFTYGTLAPGEEIAFFFRVKLDSNLRAWDGTRWHEVDDNVIQSDSVRFNIIFRLGQV
jgi:predicted ribosomally synthesized peptide with SipW-like signal peptide